MKTLLLKEWRDRRWVLLILAGLFITAHIALKIYFGTETYQIYGTDYTYNAIDHKYFELHIAFSIIFAFALGLFSFKKQFVNEVKKVSSSRPGEAGKIFLARYLSGLVVLLIPVLASDLIIRTIFNLQSPWGVEGLLAGEFSSFPVVIPAILVYTLTYCLCLYWLFLYCSIAIFIDRRKLLTILCMPLILLLGLVGVLPLIFVFPLAVPRIFIFVLVFYVWAPLSAIMVIFGVLNWHGAIEEKRWTGKKIAAVFTSILAFSFMVHAVTNIAISRSLNRTILQAKGEGILLKPEEVIPPPVPDEDNVALVYEEAFELIDMIKHKYTDEWRFMPYESVTIDRITEEQKSRIGSIMDEPEFARLYGLIQKTVRFDVGYEGNLTTWHLANLRTMARLLSARIYILAEEGRYKDALDSAGILLRFSKTSEDDPFIISSLIRVAMGSIALRTLELLLNYPEIAVSLEDCRDLIAIVEGMYFSLAPGFQREFALGVDYLTGDEVSRVKILSDDMFERKLQMYIDPDFQDAVFFKPFINLYEGYLGDPLFKSDLNFNIRSGAKLINYLQRPYFEVKDKVEEGERKIGKPGLGRWNLMAGRMLLTQAEHQAHLYATKLGLAAEIYRLEYGAYPESLEDLVPKIIPELPLDPFTGRDYIYRREDEGFVVYSVGRNETDDGGLHCLYDGDIVWRIERD